MKKFFCSTVGKKYLMGLSGFVWVAFIFVHMAGNMLILISSDLYNAYGNAIVTNKPLLFLTEAVLIAALLTHVLCAVSLTKGNRAARNSRYAISPNGEKSPSFASQWMAVHGSIILVFIISHLITFKYGAYYETTVHGVVMRDMARLIYEVLHQPVAFSWYLVSLVLLGFHLTHGVRSIFQSFGLLHPAYQPLIQKAGVVYAIVVAGGFVSQAVFVFFTATMTAS